MPPTPPASENQLAQTTAIEALRLIAIYLPQFHTIPENDAWWGRGFTEWTNVAKARPLFRGHYQPQLPADLGFYDLRVAETRAAQAELARSHGIHGFCYYHYWFEGHRLLERPFDEVRRSGEPDFPFCLCWANESWARGWIGEEKDVLIAQTYSEADHRAHARWLTQATDDPRYIRVHGRALFLVYRPRSIPGVERATAIFREEFVRAGLPEPYLVGVAMFERDRDLREFGFDLSMNFLPDFGRIPTLGDWYSKKRVLRNLLVGSSSGILRLHAHEDAVTRMWNASPRYDHLPSVLVGWDNTSRRGERGIVLTNATADAFERHLTLAVNSVRDRKPDERIVFVNAWNEWAEGNHLEPDAKYGRSFLEAVGRVMSRHATGNREQAAC